ncbi:hypothetical protein MNBD_NITROSPINAE01-1035 [hydrothermal vent metagenome]|uniref:PilZ domain-containing protein n=1 Tax=hydrothermal vent metagenome TaxID=652676 RepID=A0A3B1BSE1_9ZZZZ
MKEENERLRARVPFKTKISLELDGDEHEYGRTFDVSMNGVYVSTAKPLPVESTGEFVMTLSVGMRREQVTGRYEIIRVMSMDDGLSDTERGPGMGVKFTMLEPESSELLFNIIRYNQNPEQ